MAFLTLKYKEGVSGTFEKLVLTQDKLTKEFNTGDPIVDWFDYYRFLYNGEAYQLGIPYINHSSSVDHWFMDEETYVEKYLKEVGETLEFVTDEELNLMSLSNIDKLYRCVAHKDMKSFSEVREYVKSKTK